MKRIISVLLVAITFLSLCSCDFAPNNIRITMGVLDEVTDFDPLNADGDTENIIAANCFEGLVHIDAQGNIDLGGATAYTVDKDGLKYTFKLNPSARWYISDDAKATIKNLDVDLNKKITADDFIYGIKRFILSGKTSLNAIKGAEKFAKDEKNLTGVKAIDDYTLEITLKKVDPNFLYSLATKHIYPCDEDFFNALGEDYATSHDTLIYNGPYYLKKSDLNESIIAFNPDYTGKTQVKNSEVVLLFTGTTKALHSRFNDGTYDLISVASAYAPSNRQSICTDISTIWGLTFNNAPKKSDNSKLHQILLTSIDYSILDSTDLSDIKAKRIIPDSYLINGNQYSDFIYQSLKVDTDTKKAVTELNKLLKADKKKSLKITFAAPSEYESVAQNIVDGWDTLFGQKLTIDIIVYDKADADKIITEGSYDVAILPVSPKEKTAFGVITKLNEKGFCSVSDFTELNKNISADDTDIAKKVAALEEKLCSSGAFIPLYHTGINLYVNNVSGIYYADGGKLIYFHSGEKTEV